jgi:hypothetical protein
VEVVLICISLVAEDAKYFNVFIGYWYFFWELSKSFHHLIGLFTLLVFLSSFYILDVNLIKWIADKDILPFCRFSLHPGDIKRLSFLQHVFWHICQESGGYNVWVYFQVFYSVGLCGVVLVPYCFCFYGSGVYFEVSIVIPPAFLLQDCFGYLGSFVFPCEF